MINEYLQQMQDGNTAALAPLYDCTSKPLYTLCYSYFRNPHDSEDAVSETYLRVQTAIATFNGTNGYAWMSTIARNICVNMIKKKGRILSVDMSDEAAVHFLGEDYSESPPSVEEESEIVAVAKSVLSPHEFQILILHAVNDEKLKEIARIVKKKRGNGTLAIS